MVRFFDPPIPPAKQHISHLNWSEMVNRELSPYGEYAIFREEVEHNRTLFAPLVLHRIAIITEGHDTSSIIYRYSSAALIYAGTRHGRLREPWSAGCNCSFLLSPETALKEDRESIPQNIYSHQVSTPAFSGNSPSDYWLPYGSDILGIQNHYFFAFFFLTRFVLWTKPLG